MRNRYYIQLIVHDYRFHANLLMWFLDLMSSFPEYPSAIQTTTRLKTKALNMNKHIHRDGVRLQLSETGTVYAYNIRLLLQIFARVQLYLPLNIYIYQLGSYIYIYIYTYWQKHFETEFAFVLQIWITSEKLSTWPYAGNHIYKSVEKHAFFSFKCQANNNFATLYCVWYCVLYLWIINCHDPSVAS